MAINNMNQPLNRRKRRVMGEINITPLVDVMLVLLIIFMITSPMLVAGINVNLPDSSLAPVTSQEEPLTLTVDKNAKVYLFETQVPQNQLKTKLRAITKEKYNTVIYVRGDRDVNYGQIMSVISEIKDAGFNKVALITNIKTQ